ENPAAFADLQFGFVGCGVGHGRSRIGSAMHWVFGSGSAWRHADGAVEPDGLAVEHGVVDDLFRQLSVLAGHAEAAGIRDGPAERVADLLGGSREDRRVE